MKQDSIEIANNQFKSMSVSGKGSGMKYGLISLMFLMATVACEEDKSLELPSPCLVPTPKVNLKFEPEQLTFSWDKIENYQYGISLWQTARNRTIGVIHNNPSDTFATLDPPHPGVTYYLEIRVLDGSGDPNEALNRCNGSIEPQSFTAPCTAYNNIKVFILTATSVLVRWSGFGEPTSKLFTVNFKKKGVADVTLIGTDKNEVEIASLERITEYQVQLASTCTDGQVYLSQWFDFKTP
jgi:hypothetical protein